jgi:lactate dehydrogenase-like 2-hydroxyacid dehydrogenase
MSFNVLVTGQTFQPQFIELLRDRSYEVEFHPEFLAEAELAQAMQDKDALILGGTEFVSAKTLESASKLRVVAIVAVGYQSYIDIDAATRKGIAVTNTPNANARATAEMTIALMTALRRKIPSLNSMAKSGVWADGTFADNLHGATLGIIGAGAIGSLVAEIAGFGFGMNLLYHNRSAKPVLEERTKAQRVSLDELLRRSDVVSLHLPITNETAGLLGKHEFQLMKPTALLVNTARPQIVDPFALANALGTKSIAGCGMDGYYEEPAPSAQADSYGLLSLSDEIFLLAPHVGYLTHDSVAQMCQMAVESVISILEKRTGKNVVRA